MTLHQHNPRAIVLVSLLLGASAALAQAAPGGSNTAGMAGSGTPSSMTGDSSSGTTRPPVQMKPDPDSDAARKARSDPRAEGSGSRGGNTNPAPTGPQDANSNGRSVSETGKKIVRP